jgi:hypothetical protein
MKNLPTSCQMQDWQKQAAQDLIQWHKALGNIKNERDENALQAGHFKGFMDALGLLRLHAGLSLPNTLPGK